MRPLEAPSGLAAQQVAFAAHLRDPEHAPPPAGIEDRRMAVYRELFYNSLEDLLAGNFPVIRALRDAAWWHGLVRAFYREHRCHTPLFTQIGREFLRYLESLAEAGSLEPPFLHELAHYEWVELALSLDQTDLSAIECVPDGDLLDGVPVASPLAWPLAYRFPVHAIRAEFQPESAPEQPTFLLVVRDRAHAIRFNAIDALGFHLLQALHGNEAGHSGRAILQALAAQAGANDVEAFVANGARLLAQLREREAVLGTRVRA